MANGVPKKERHVMLLRIMFHDELSRCVASMRVSRKTHSWFVILLLELVVNLKGIIIYDHQRPQYHFHDVALHSFRSRRSATLSYQAPASMDRKFQRLTTTESRTMLPWRTKPQLLLPQ